MRRHEGLKMSNQSSIMWRHNHCVMQPLLFIMYPTVPLSFGWLEKKVQAMLTKYKFLCIAQGSKLAYNENLLTSPF